MIKTVVSIITVILSILQTSLDEFHIFKLGSVLPILGSILRFCIHNYAWGSLLPRGHSCGRTGLMSERSKLESLRDVSVTRISDTFPTVFLRLYVRVFSVLI